MLATVGQEMGHGLRYTTLQRTLSQADMCDVHTSLPCCLTLCCFNWIMVYYRQM